MQHAKHISVMLQAQYCLLRLCSAWRISLQASRPLLAINPAEVVLQATCAISDIRILCRLCWLRACQLQRMQSFSRSRLASFCLVVPFWPLAAPFQQRFAMLQKSTMQCRAPLLLDSRRCSVSALKESWRTVFAETQITKSWLVWPINVNTASSVLAC